MVEDEIAKEIKSEISNANKMLKDIKEQKKQLDAIKPSKDEEEDLIKAKGFLAQKISLLIEMLDSLQYARGQYLAFYDRADSNFTYYISKATKLAKQLKEKEQDPYYLDLLNKFINKVNSSEINV